MFQNSLNKWLFYAIKGFFEINEKQRATIFFVFAYLMMLATSLIFSPIVLFFRKSVWSLFMNFGRNILMRFSIDLAATLQLIGLQFYRRLAGLFFLGTRVISPLLCVIDKCPFVQLQLRAFSKKGFTLFQKTLQNSAGSPSVPGLLFEAIVFKSLKTLYQLKDLHTLFRLFIKSFSEHFGEKISQLPSSRGLRPGSKM